MLALDGTRVAVCVVIMVTAFASAITDTDAVGAFIIVIDAQCVDGIIVIITTK